MAAAIAERGLCRACVARGDLAGVAKAFSSICCKRGDFASAEAFLERLVAETERLLGAEHRRLGSALVLLARCKLDAGEPPETIYPLARRGWGVLRATLGATSPSPEVEGAIILLGELLSRAPHLDADKSVDIVQRVLDWASANDRMPAVNIVLRIPRHIAERALPKETLRARMDSRLETRRREKEERQRAEEERERARREAERAERAARDAADREAAKRRMGGSQWAPAKKLLTRLDALLKPSTPPPPLSPLPPRVLPPPPSSPPLPPNASKRGAQRSPGDFEGRLLRIQCMAGAGQLEEAGREAERAERALAGAGASADALQRVQDQRRVIAGELLQREEAKKREEAQRREEMAAKRKEEEEEALRAKEQRRAQERRQLQRKEQKREEARPQAEGAERQRAAEQLQQRRREEERRAAQAAAAAAAPAETSSPPPSEAGPSSGRWSEAAAAAAACRFFARGLCRNGDRCRYRHEARADAGAGAGDLEPGPAPAPFAAPEGADPGPAGEPGPECAICLGPLSAGPPAAALPCRHRFHGPCIEAWRRAIASSGGAAAGRRPCPFRCPLPARPTRPYLPPGLFSTRASSQ
eukprot:tig00021044_g17645.t1